MLFLGGVGLFLSHQLETRVECIFQDALTIFFLSAIWAKLTNKPISEGIVKEKNNEDPETKFQREKSHKNKTCADGKCWNLFFFLFCSFLLTLFKQRTSCFCLGAEGIRDWIIGGSGQMWGYRNKIQTILDKNVSLQVKFTHSLTKHCPKCTSRLLWCMQW